MFSESDRQTQFPPQPRRSSQKESMIERTVSLGMLASKTGAEIQQTLHSQQQLLDKLRNELDAEREASSTAATEALAMILRLQCERAALQMETRQFKRLSEAKMCHAETSLAVFEDSMYKKEMEIASLESQVHAFRCKLLSLGCTDVSVAENKFPESLKLEKRDAVFEETTIRRLRSLASCQIDRVKDEGNLKNELETVMSGEEVIAESLDGKKSPGDPSSSPHGDLDGKKSRGGSSSSPHGDLDFYWEQIKKIDEHVHEISVSRDLYNVSSEKSVMNEDSPSSSTEFEEYQTRNHGKSIMRERSESEDKDGRGHNRTQLGRILSNPIREFETELQGMKKRVEELEGEIEKKPKGKSLLFLREIYEMVNSIKSEIANLRPDTKKSRTSQQDDLSLHVIQEAMLHFWC